MAYEQLPGSTVQIASGGQYESVDSTDSSSYQNIAAQEAASAYVYATQAAASATAAAGSATSAASSATTATTAVSTIGSSVTAAAASATAAAASATTADTRANAASASATAAATSATTAATSAATATTQATSASTSAANAATSATSASNSASTATTQATNASNSASSASNSATSATNSATNAANSATNASTSATASSTSATNAATSAVNSAASASSASASAVTAVNARNDAQSYVSQTSGFSLAAQQSAAAAAISEATSETNADLAVASSASASTSASTASTAATTATTQAGIATTQAGISTTQANTAMAQASIAVAQATAAGTSATNAATSATNAATSATTATTQATNASNSAAAALSIYGSTAAQQAAVASAQNSATTATTQASLADTARVGAEAARDAAIVAQNNAVAVVTGGTATLIAEPGKIPLADAQAKISHAWITNSALVEQTDIGTAPNEIPLNQYLGNLAYQDAANIAGPVGIGSNTVISVADNTNAALRITQTGTGNALVVEDATSTDATPFVIDANGVVVKGYTANVSTIDAISVHSAGTSSQLAFSAYNWNASGVARFALYRSYGGAAGTYGIVANNAELGRQQFFGDDGTAFIPAASISAAVDGTPGANDMPGRLVFSTTADGASTPTERVRITSAGKTGFATAAPAATVHVAGNTILSNVNVLGASYDNVSFSVAAQETTVGGLFFSPDGFKMYVVGSGNDNVNEYKLSTAWVVSSAVFVTSFGVNAQDGAATGVFFRADGTKMYVLGSSNDSVFQYTLSTPWSVATASYDSVSFSVAGQDTAPNGFWFKPNGLSMYVVGSAGDAVYQYTLSTAWNVSTATFLQSFSVSGQEASPNGMTFTGDGSRMFVAGASGDDVTVYNLTTPWDISTAATIGQFSVLPQDGAPADIYIKPDGTKMYILGNDSPENVYQYTVPSIDIQLTGPTSVAALDVQQDLTVYGKLEAYSISASNVGVGTSSPLASAILDIQSTTKGVRMPNMTTTQKNAIASPAAGLMVFDTTLAKLSVYSGVAWETITSI